MHRSPATGYVYPPAEQAQQHRALHWAVLVALLSGAFLVLCVFFVDFVLDDSFITYRYASHLAQGQGLTWNAGQDPVEGYTSLLWVGLNALAIRSGLDPVAFSKLVAVMAGLALIALLCAAAIGHHWSLAAVLAGAVALSPPFALMTMQGMETALTALLVLILAWISVALLKEQPAERPASAGAAAWALRLGWFVAALLCLLARPDTLVFSAAAFVGLAAVWIARKDLRALARFLVAALPAAAAGAAYTAWRVSYFGYLLPNTYIVKMLDGACTAEVCGPAYPLSFLTSVLWPYLLLGLLLLWHSSARRRALRETAPLLLGSLAFGVYLATIDPIEGFMWRFAYPVWPAFLLMVGWWARESTAFDLARRARSLSLGVLVVFAAWALYPMPAALRAAAQRTQADRVAVGQQLAGLPGRMLVSKSGALPFYSDWYAVDELGLHSEEVARQGLTLAFLEQLQPDLVMVQRQGKYQTPSPGGSREIVNRYMVENGFVALAVTRRVEDCHHFYFARQDSPLYEEIAARVRRVETVQYGDLAELMREPRIALYGSGRQ